MKKLCAFLLVLAMLLSCAAMAEEDEAWRTAPVITKAYEIASGKLYLEWEGNAPLYRVYMDGASVADVIVNNAVIDVAKGTHIIFVYPVSEAKAVDTKIDFSLDNSVMIGIDLAALGINPQNLAAGNPSAPLNIDYMPNSLVTSVPEDLTATTDADNRVLLSFTDRQYSEEYIVAIKIGKDTSYVRFSTVSEDAALLITKKGATVTLTLDPTFLEQQECIVPELGSKYTFTVQLRKSARDLVSGESVVAVVHESKVSKGYQYTPVAAWKAAPVITYASQTADGQVTLRWEHEDYALGCEYRVMKVKKSFGIRSGLDEVAVTSENSCVIDDLMNGSHAYVVIPCFAGETGEESEAATVEVKNDWVVAPVLSCVQTADNQVTLTWNAAEGVAAYHVVVFTGDNASLLRYVNLDYTKYGEYDVPVSGDTVEFVFTLDEMIDPDLGEKVRFEVYGIRYAANGDAQRTATTKHSMTMMVNGTSAE